MMRSLNVIGSLAAIAILLAIYVPGGEGGGDKKHVRIRGQYILKTSPEDKKLLKYMQEIKMSKESIKEVQSTKKVIMVFESVNKTHRSIQRITQNGSCALVFEDGKEFEAIFMDGRKFKNVIKINMEEKTIHREIHMDGYESNQDFVFSLEGFNLTMKGKKAAATIEFLRWGGMSPSDYFEHGEVPT